MVDEQLRIATESGKQILGRITGNESSDTILIFSHGFGVKSDSRGMFNLLVERYQERFLTVRFHYVVVDDITQDIFAISYSEQVEKLLHVVSKVQKKYGKKKIILISHSQGCGVSCKYIVEQNAKLAKHIMLAPPPTKNVAERTREKFGKRKGAVLNESGMSIYPRTDGSQTVIPPNFWAEAEAMKPLEWYRKTAEMVPTVVIWGTQDTTIQQENYSEIKVLPVKRLVELPNGHEFMEDNMQGVIKVLDEELT